ncbi:MAG TPA: flagellar basal body rod protein FlgB [Methylocella sp.]|nr:flagellar basal body rod protein FlgB [Methylocella sp.]
MKPILLFELASQQARWLSARQVAVAENIANANTPGYKAVDVPPFEAVLNNGNISLSSTNPLHFGADPAARDSIPLAEEASWEVTHSGNSVNLDQELMKSGEVGNASSLNRAIVRVFNQMLMTSLKG